MVSRHDIVMC